MSEPVLSLDIRDRADLTTVLDTIDELVSFSWHDPEADEGDATLVVHNDFAPASLVPDAVIVGSLDGTPAFAVIVDVVDTTLVDRNEEAQEFTVATGRMLRTLVDNGQVDPTLGVDRYPYGDTRTFSFADPSFATDGAWVEPSVIVATVITDSFGYTGMPAGFWSIAEPWLGTATGDDTEDHLGYLYGVYDFTLADDLDVAFAVAVDDRGVFFIDGYVLAVVAPGSDPTSGYRTATSVIIRLSAGDHRFAWKLVNDFGHEDPGFGAGTVLAGNPFAYAFTAWETAGGQLIQRLFGTADYADMLQLEFPATAPGMSIRQVAGLVLAENQTAGFLTGVTLDGSDTLDSAGNAWDVYEFITVDVGRSLFALLKEWSQTYCDWDLPGPTDLTVFMWRWHERGSTPGVTYSVANENLDRLVRRALGVVADSLLTRWADGWTLVPASGGAKRGALQLGAARSINEAGTLAGQQVALQGVVQTMYLVEVAPAGAGDVPYLDCTHADIVTVGPATERIVQIEGALVDDVLALGLGCQDRILRVQEQLSNVIGRLSNGSLGGTALPASPAAALGSFTSRAAESEVTFQFLDPVTAQLSPAKRLSSSRNLFAVAATATTAGATDTNFEFLVDGVDILGGLGVLVAGDKYTVIGILSGGTYVTVWINGRLNELQVDLTTVGGTSCAYPDGITGLLIEPWFV